MTFKEILQAVAVTIPVYRRLIFSSIVTALLVGKGGKHIQGIHREFALLLTDSSATLKRFYGFINSRKLPWAAIRGVVYDMLRPMVEEQERLLLVLDDTIYGKSGRHIAGCATHFNHASKDNESDYVHGHCRVLVAGCSSRFIGAGPACRWSKATTCRRRRPRTNT